MLAVVKAPLISFTIQGKIPMRVIDFLRREYGEGLKIHERGSLPVKETGWYQKMKKQAKPGDAIRIYRQNHNWTQEELGAKIGVSKYRVSDLENSRRDVSKQLAKRLASLFAVPVERFI